FQYLRYVPGLAKLPGQANMCVQWLSVGASRSQVGSRDHQNLDLGILRKVFHPIKHVLQRLVDGHVGVGPANQRTGRCLFCCTTLSREARSVTRYSRSVRHDGSARAPRPCPTHSTARTAWTTWTARKTWSTTWR